MHDHITPVFWQLHWLPVRHSELSLNWLCWFTRHCMVLLHGIWWTTANSSLLPAAVNYGRQMLHNPMYLYLSWRLCTCSCRTTFVEQLPKKISSVQPVSWTILLGAETYWFWSSPQHLVSFACSALTINSFTCLLSVTIWYVTLHTVNATWGIVEISALLVACVLRVMMSFYISLFFCVVILS